ncbi:facilitated trehalose transporter Tret1 isoform X1 [Plutella xylostella]|uniref:facilitated trehalose transporter Tret1 isoform X1 n=2 Tax=Plutella xylostella TaxID=51655 RepID=UPI002032E636|nr:facilitated trehalose transporter Tret1 isoform X1 [Plutella xylostella]XP_011557924.3 facilitated trehalose transporter Tret1 isoform X1 [Plutella xylostella]
MSEKRVDLGAAIDRAGSPFLRQLTAVSGVVLYMVGTGANIAFPAVLLLQLRSSAAVRLEPHHESWIASLLGLALMCGIAVSPWSLQRLGRKVTNQLSTLPCLAGWALLMMSREPWELLASRALQGFGMGLQASAAPVSIAEYSSPAHRGAFLATIAFSFATGMLLAHVFGTLLYWRAAALACGSVYALSLILVTFSPETPPWLASQGQYDKCKKAFRWLRGRDPNSEKELEILLSSQRNRRDEVHAKVSRWRAFVTIVRKPEFYKPTLIMVFMFVLFQMSGMTVVPSYTVQLMNEVSNHTIDPSASMLMVDAVRFVTAVVACVVVNKFPRRTVLFFGSLVSAISLLIAALLLYLRDLGYINETYQWVPVIPTLVYIFGKTIGILPIPWAVAGEVFPLAYRSMGSGISGMVLSMMFFVVVKTAPATFSAIGVNGTFCLYAVSILICVGFLYFLLPETKGKTLYEIECHFRGEKPAGAEKDNMLELETLEGG